LRFAFRHAREVVVAGRRPPVVSYHGAETRPDAEQRFNALLAGYLLGVDRLFPTVRSGSF